MPGPTCRKGAYTLCSSLILKWCALLLRLQNLKQLESCPLSRGLCVQDHSAQNLPVYIKQQPACLLTAKTISALDRTRKILLPDFAVDLPSAPLRSRPYNF